MAIFGPVLSRKTSLLGSHRPHSASVHAGDVTSLEMSAAITRNGRSRSAGSTALSPELVLLLQLSQPVCGIGGHRRGIGRLQVEAIEARRVQTEYSLLDRAVGVAEGRKVAPTSCMRSTNESLLLRLAQPLLQQDCSKFYQTSLQAVSFRSLLAGQIRTGTPTSTGLLRLGGAARGATSQLHQRRRVEAADSSPSNRAAFSRAAMAKLASALVSVISVLACAHARVRPVTFCAVFKTTLFHFEPRKVGLQLLDPRVQAVDLLPVTTRWPGGQQLILDFGEIDGNSHYRHSRPPASIGGGVRATGRPPG